jgi:hypothetical protein
MGVKVLVVQKAQKETWDHLDPRAKMEIRVQKVIQDLWVLLDPKVRKEIREQKDLQVHKEYRVLKVEKVQKEI